MEEENFSESENLRWFGHVHMTGHPAADPEHSEWLSSGLLVIVGGGNLYVWSQSVSSNDTKTTKKNLGQDQVDSHMNLHISG